MALFDIPNIRIAGISACVPEKEISNKDYKWVSEKERESLIKNVGVLKKRAVERGTTTADLCEVAAEQLLTELGWDRMEIDMLLFISQSRDYTLPATAGILQHKMGLPKSCIAFDVSLGCSGYVYGLSVIGSLMNTSGISKALLLVGDISTLNASYRDKSTYPLFGDAGTATALSLDKKANPLSFNLQTDGAGYEAIIVPHSGFRYPITRKSFDFKKYAKGVHRHQLQVALNGIDVFNFSLREVSPNIMKLLARKDRSVEEFDYYIFHQANKLILDTIRRKLKLDKTKVPISLDRYGNTSSASIPLTIVTELQNEISDKHLKMIWSGFGVGLSWGSVIVETKKIICPKVLIYSK